MRGRWTAAIGLLAVVVAVFLVETSGSPEPPPPVEPSAAPPPVATVEDFCAAFSYFAASYSDQLGNPDRDTAAPLEAAGAELLAVGRPPGMSDLEATGLAVFVEDTLRPFRHLATPGAPSPTAVTPLTDDETLALETFNAFLTKTCQPTY